MSCYTAPEPARPGDLAALISLVGLTEGCAAQTVWNLPWDLQHYCVIRQGDQLVAAGSMQPVGDGCRVEIRGLVVDAGHRGQGLATVVVEHLCALAGSAGLEVVCVTRAPQFFERHGFAPTAPDWLPVHRVDPEQEGRPRVALARCPGVAA